MLKFVIGTAGTGKSQYIADRIVQLAQQGEKCLLLIPEQFSKTAEAMIFSALDDVQSNSVEVFSFTGLMRDVNTNHTRMVTTPLTDAGKAVLARRAADNVKKHLVLYSKQSNNFGFSFNLASAFDDLKRSGITADIFYSLAQNAPARSVRLKELALIYAEYCGLMDEKFRDSEDLLTKLAFPDNRPALTPHCQSVQTPLHLRSGPGAGIFHWLPQHSIPALSASCWNTAGYPHLCRHIGAI